MRRAFGAAWVILAAGLAGAFTRADDPPAKGDVVVTDINGKEHKLTAVKLAAGTRHLGWLAEGTGTGPLAIELREPNSTTFAKGIITLIPAASVESAKYDYEQQIVSVTVKGIKEPLTGTLEYANINVLGVSGMEDGKPATFRAGVLGKGAVKSLTFAGAVPLPPVPKEAAEKGWSVKIVQSKKATMESPPIIVRNMKALYQFTGGTDQLVNGIPVRKGTPIPFDANLKRFELLANDENTGIAAAEIEVGAGPEKIIAIPLTSEQEKKTGTLVGFLGEVDAGYKLFPLHTVKSITPFEKKRD